MQTLLDFHKVWGYVAIVMNAIAGVIALVAWRWRKARGRYVWIATIIAESALMLQVLVGTILVASKDYVAPRFHMFYGFVAFHHRGARLPVPSADAWSHRDVLRPRRPVPHGARHPGRAAGRMMWPDDGARLMARKQRVLLLFGGRSAEHDVSRVTAVAVARGARSRPVRRRARRDHDRRQVVVGRLGALIAPSKPRAERVRVECLPDRRCRLASTPVARSTSTSCSRCSTVPTARTAPCRGCSSWPTCRMSARASSGPPSRWTR